MTLNHERLAGTDCWIADGQNWLSWEQAEALADDLAVMAPWLVVSASHRYERHNRMDLPAHSVLILNITTGHHWSVGTCDQAHRERAVVCLLSQRR